ncbi:hypothetical protein LPB73_06660 [Tardiphaga sp. 37S4]|uniref:hypothetical protein n=1 Tax=Tardiphaga sp. 37S4 TaxID=1404741 RepID=UPI001E434F69|nr:hypothetical protein [Tardiphaga sp. 37S4]UFS77058.1 hypothetical protein LPB73_06660 [Tardiphaga sp. 37S4]
MDIATLGSYVALVLAGLKVLEFFRDRKPKLSIETLLRGSVEMGNDILLFNSSKIPARVYYYELIWMKPKRVTRWLGLRREQIGYQFSLEDSTADISVDGYSLATLNFSDEDHFDWGDDAENDLYLKLSIVGRKRPLWFWITGPKS